MDRTADKSTPLWMPWREALKRAGSFDELRPYLHTGQIPARHGGLFTLPDGKRIAGLETSRQKSGPSSQRPGRAGDILHRRGGVWAPRPRAGVRLCSSIELDSVAFDTFFPVADLPPADASKSMPRRQGRRAQDRPHLRRPHHPCKSSRSRCRGRRPGGAPLRDMIGMKASSSCARSWIREATPQTR